MPNVYKLQYASKASLESALLSRGIIDEEGQNAQETHAVVHLGNIVLEPAELDNQGNETKAAVISDKYHADIMVESEFSFGANEVQIAEGQPQAHSFA